MKFVNQYHKVKNYINGEWVVESDVKYAPLFNPSTGEQIGEVPMSSQDASKEAVKCAAEAYKTWSKTPLPKRIDFIFKIRDVMEENFENLAVSIAIDQAKHITEARGEVRRVIEIVQMACSVPALIQGETIQGIANNINGRVVKQSMGVFCGVAPFNFPALVFGWFIPYAIATGNTFVYKPSTDSPLFMQEMMFLLNEIGLPKGVVNVVHGDRSICEAWYEDPAVVGVCLVGSTPTAKAIAEACGRNGKRVMLLGGAKNYLVAMEDAPMDLMIENILISGYGSAGQRCLAVSNLAVVDEIYDEFVERLVAASKDLQVGDAFDTDVFMGPVINQAAQKRIEDYIEIGIKEGANLVLDGRNPSVASKNKDGYYVGPTIFTDVTPCMTLAKEEVFGPVLSVMRVGCINGALKLIGEQTMGNGAVIFTQNAYYIEKFIDEADVGMVGVNVGVCAPHPYLPFGGIKDSLVGTNKVQGKDGIEFFTQNKVATIRTVNPKGENSPKASGDSSVRSCVAS
ncbi:CoA-acylating methylmalonate-semialdehyde dehydrogenase [Dasania marina]|uniref:CoA-acylating methylmalonate-semialdehyde dehydrogenase n=1 Tax=Dasania marina TaxID=471499 RepID=UPI0003623CD0|nr:CoA-acylating methylmalonate-semialdehyde dehydrogenase [Dasania marina]